MAIGNDIRTDRAGLVPSLDRSHIGERPDAGAGQAQAGGPVAEQARPGVPATVAIDRGEQQLAATAFGEGDARALARETAFESEVRALALADAVGEVADRIHALLR